MRPRVRDVPAAILCLALALSRGERREALQIAQFVRGLSIQVSLRMISGEILSDGTKATLLYSRLDKPRAGVVRSVAAIATASLAGVVLFVIANALLLLPVALVMRLAGVSADNIADTALIVAVARLSWTAYRAVQAYRLERQRQAQMPRLGQQPRWRLDLMGATPPGRGHGAAVLKEFVRQADAAGATVYLVTEPHNRAFYRRAGFHLQPSPDPPFEGMLLMRRVAPSTRVPAQRAGQVKQPALR